MRTLVVIHSLKMGGMERVAVNLADAFAEQGHDSHLLSCRNRPNDLKPADNRVTLHHWDQLKHLMASVIGIPVFLLSRLLLGVILPRSHFMWVGWLHGWLLKRHIRKLERRHGRFDRIIFRGLGTFKYFWSFRDDRCVYVLENVIHHDRPLWQKRWEWKLVFDDRHLVCVSSGVMESAKEAFALGRIHPKSLRVITNPCPVESIQSLAQENDPDIPDKRYIVNVARLVPQKGHALLMEAFARADIPHQLVIVGEGPLREELEQKARDLGITERVLFAGKRRNPYPWMRKADLFVLASEYEGLGIVLTEALACGTPILSTDSRGGVRFVFQGALERYLTPPNPEGLAAGLERTIRELPITIRPEWLAPFRSDVVVSAFLTAPEEPTP
ncbi:Glycosyltransferase involved in cell wall bisynthesis [Marinobacter segnicrescens]|uniref:Glycosyltransferase involved in cell wall bisynthesis n=1 Tax=Marinobacter segnicrescens TaxID=430453 RepID=A0A1I0DX32_9GAMM|nr:MULTISPECIES: glycosyltransferase [Marinobacter]UZD66657.1 glycosyltransferase [Marinobacter sp. AN1]SET36941.1 Glycosyltransferase involved in cell wall bisynthesis [Marinobacter segnicrescens]